MDTELLLSRIEKYSQRYNISFQFWGDGNNNCFINKDDVEIHSSGGHDTIKEALSYTLEYLDRINSNNTKQG